MNALLRRQVKSDKDTARTGLVRRWTRSVWTKSSCTLCQNSQSAEVSGMPFDDVVTEIQGSLTVGHIASLEPLLKVASSQNSPDEIQRIMDEFEIDVVPLGESGVIREYYQRSASAFVKKPVTTEELISTDTPILELLADFAQLGRSYYFTFRGRGVNGIVTIGDLNRPAVRVLLYASLSRVELHLQRLVALRLEESVILDLLGAKAAEVRTQLQEGRAANRNLHVTAYLELSDFLKILKRERNVRSELGFASSREVEARLGPLVRLRNDVAHPVRDLVGSHRTVTRLDEVIRLMATVSAQLERLPVQA